jgi:hypothetical protein
MTYMESVGTRRVPPKQLTDQYAEAVRTASWRIALHLGDEHELAMAYAAVTQAFDHWNDVASGTLSAAKRLGRPDSVIRFGERFGQAWDLARERTRASLREYTAVARRYVGLSSYVDAGEAEGS